MWSVLISSVCSFAGARFERCSFIRSLGRGVDLADISLLSCNLYQSELSEARIRRAEKSIFAECQLVSTNFEEALLDGALFAKSDASNAKFDRARLKGALFPKAVLAGASFEGAHAPRSVWSDADLRDANLARLHAEGATFRNASLAGADVEGACLVETELHGVKETLAGADLRNSRGTVDWRAERESVAHKLPRVTRLREPHSIRPVRWRGEPVTASFGGWRSVRSFVDDATGLFALR